MHGDMGGIVSPEAQAEVAQSDDGSGGKQQGFESPGAVRLRLEGAEQICDDHFASRIRQDFGCKDARVLRPRLGLFIERSWKDEPAWRRSRVAQRYLKMEILKRRFCHRHVRVAKVNRGLRLLPGSHRITPDNESKNNDEDLLHGVAL